MSGAPDPSTERPPATTDTTSALRAAEALYEAIVDERLAEALRLVDPGVVVEEHPPFADASALHGHPGLVRLLRIYADAFEARRVAIEEIAAGTQAVLVRLRLEIDEDGATRDPVTLFHVVSFNAGKATWIRVFRDRAGALAAAGLED